MQNNLPLRQLEHSLDGLLAGSLRDFERAPVAARLRLCAAWVQTKSQRVSHPLVQALLAKSVAIEDPTSALAILRAALKRDPDNAVLWSQYWGIVRQDATAYQSEAWQPLLRQRLPFLSQPAELRAILELLKHPPTAAMVEGQMYYIGYGRWDVVKQVVSGWALNLHAPELPSKLTLRVTGSHRQGNLIADAPVDLMQQAGISSVGGFTVRLPRSVDSLEILFEDGTALFGSPFACVEPMMPSPPRNRLSTLDRMVDVLVPVYEGREATLRCIDSLLESKAIQNTPHDIVVLDDASRDALLVSRLQTWAQQGWIQLVQRRANLGFIRNVNRGMSLHPDRDVVWLNSDTRVTGNWLDRLRQAAYADARTATVTPWSNDGEFMTLGGRYQAEPMPDASVQSELDQLLRERNLPPVELISGCGFCFYIKRQAIESVGWLDEIDLVDGYGEETDWCMRARALGWQHVGATNVFVAHEGGQSFGMRKSMLAHYNNHLIRQRYPMAERLHQAYLRQDPLQRARDTIARLRWQHWLEGIETYPSLPSSRHPLLKSPSVTPIPLLIRRVSMLDAMVTDRDNTPPLLLSWQVGDGDSRSRLRLRLSIHVIQPALHLSYRLPEDAAQLTQDLMALKVHVSPDLTWEAAVELPPRLADCVEQALGASNHASIQPDTIVRRRSWHPRQHDASVPLGSGLALIGDDLRDAKMVDDWLRHIRRVQQSESLETLGICLVTGQPVPGAQLLRRAGLVAPVHCPEGLTWKQWLALLGIHCVVTLGTERTLSGDVRQELGVDLPVMTWDHWIRHCVEHR